MKKVLYFVVAILGASWLALWNAGCQAAFSEHIFQIAATYYPPKKQKVTLE